MEDLERENKALKNAYRLLNDKYKSLMDEITVYKVYHCKKRNNTTIVFKDGHSVTVKKMKGDKDCLHTAIAYALAKNIYSINLIAKNVEEK